MKKAALLGLFTDRNFGDPLICQTVSQLYDMQAGQPFEWVKADLRHAFIRLPRTAGNRMLKYVSEAVLRIADFTHWESMYRMRIGLLSKAYVKQVEGCDLAIIAGGGIIHYRHHDYWQNISAFIVACGRLGIPVAVNAVGIEDYDAGNLKCRMLSSYLRQDIVKSVTTRDDIDVLKLYMEGSHAVVGKIIDPVIFCSRMTGIQRNENSQTVGIGIIRKNIFSDFHVEFNHKRLASFYADIIRSFEQNGTSYRLFTNGLEEDLDILPDIESKLGHSLEVTVPQSANDLIRIVSGFKGIITARMHSCIVAYSLGVPAVGLVWNRKLEFWGRNIGCSSCFLALEGLDPALAIRQLDTAMQEGYDRQLREQLEEEHLKSVSETLKALS